jgi:hypothetical protein
VGRFEEELEKGSERGRFMDHTDMDRRLEYLRDRMGREGWFAMIPNVRSSSNLQRTCVHDHDR